MPRYLWVACWLVFEPLGFAQDYTITASDEAGLPSDSIACNVTIGHPEPARGFSFGFTFDDSVLTLLSIQEGAAVQATNAGSGADFFFTDIDPAGGPGGLVGCVVSLQEPIEDIPAASANEAAILNFVVAATAPAGAFTSVDFSSSLGNPTVAVVISVAGVSHPPVADSGSVVILTPPVDNLVCDLTNPCNCGVTLTWTNPAAYQEIRIRENGILIDTLAGDATAYAYSLGSPPASAALEVIAVGLNATLSTAASCVTECPQLIPPVSPQNLSCAVNPTLCEATVTWTNPEDYSAIEIFVDGVLDQTLDGDATSAIVLLDPDTDTEVCLEGVGSCGLPFLSVCCLTNCKGGPSFVRGDADGDGLFNGLLDALFMLNFAFVPGSPAPVCLEACDTDGDLSFNGLLDSLHTLNFAFIPGSPGISAPHPDCGTDPDPASTIGCNPNGCP